MKESELAPAWCQVRVFHDGGCSRVVLAGRVVAKDLTRTRAEKLRLELMTKVRPSSPG